MTKLRKILEIIFIYYETITVGEKILRLLDQKYFDLILFTNQCFISQHRHICTISERKNSWRKAINFDNDYFKIKFN